MISILAFPATGYPYIERFYEALTRRGTRVVNGVYAGRWLLQNARGFEPQARRASAEA